MAKRGKGRFSNKCAFNYETVDNYNFTSGDIVPQSVDFLNPVARPKGYLLKTFFVYFFEIFFQREFLTAIHAVEGYDPSTDNQLDLPAAVSTSHIFNIT
jgi:hypothetical protein